MVKNVLNEMGISSSTLIVQPKDLVGTDNNVIKKVFKAARSKNMESRDHLAILWFEDIDFICTANGKNLEMLYGFLAEIDQLKEEDDVLILATTS